MNCLEFIENMDKYTYQNAQKLDFDYHINLFDFPLRHSHKDYWEFTILTNGSINNILNNKTECYTANTLFYATTKDEHYFKKIGVGGIRYINISVRETRILKILDGINPDFKLTLINGKHSCPIPEDIIYKIEDYLYKINSISFSQYEIREQLLCSSLLLILQYLFSTQINIFSDTMSIDNVWMSKLSAIMQKSDFPTYSVNDLCNQLGYSRMQLNRIFHQHFNKTPHEYLIDYKLRFAKGLLKNTDMRIIDIAMTTGYSTLSQFQLNFKNNYGGSPGEYRKNSRR